MTIEVKRRKVRDGGMSYGHGRRRGGVRYPATWAVSVNGTVVGYYHGASSDGGSWSAPTVQANWQATADGVEAGLGYIVLDGGWQQVRERIEQAVVRAIVLMFRRGLERTLGALSQSCEPSRMLSRPMAGSS